MFQTSLPQLSVQQLAIKLTPAAERVLMKSAHPWVFSKSISKINKLGKAGDIAILFRNKDNKAYGVGLYDPDSPIQIKMLHHYSSQTIDRAFFSKKIKQAYERRKDLLETKTNSYRLLFGENDGFPGLIADVYANVLVVKLYSRIWFPFLKDITEELISSSGCDCVVLRLSRQLQSASTFGLKDGEVIYGELKEEVVQFSEHGIQFSANVLKGHKTGYFLDHRHNRRKVGSLSKNKTVLDVFSYAGGFSVHALANGAKEVTSVDISEQALELARQNGRLNPYSGKHITLAGDAFSILKELIQQKKKFDIVVIDPPSFAKSEKEVPLAKKKYAQLAMLGAQLISKNGILVLASCSSRISAEAFLEINKKTFSSMRLDLKLWEFTQHDIDHPITFTEAAYLKCGYYSNQAIQFFSKNNKGISGLLK